MLDFHEISIGENVSLHAQCCIKFIEEKNKTKTLIIKLANNPSPLVTHTYTWL